MCLFCYILLHLTFQYSYYRDTRVSSTTLYNFYAAYYEDARLVSILAGALTHEQQLFR